MADSVFRQNRDNRGLNRPASYLNSPIRMDIHVNFAANTKFRQVNARFNGEQSSRQNAASFVGFKIVHVRSVAMNLLSQAVACAVAEIFSVPARFDHVAMHHQAIPDTDRIETNVHRRRLNRERGR